MPESSNYEAEPAGVSVEQNIAEAQQYASTHSIAETYLWFYQQVRNGGPWDYKQQDPQFEVFGNWHYGVIGTAIGIPDWVLARMAGWAQGLAGTSMPEWGSPLGSAPYGDDPADQEAIQRGIEWARENGHETSMLFPEHQINLPMIWDLEGWGGINPYGIDPTVNTHYRQSQISVSPLVFDLDGDGIEITPQSAGQISFDHNADGIRTSTAWASSDDGLLALDRNGNGTMRSGNHLVIRVLGDGGQITVADWYASTACRIEEIRLADGKRATSAQVDSLVQAMAAFAPPAPGQTSLTAAQQTALAPVLAASWV